MGQDPPTEEHVALRDRKENLMPQIQKDLTGGPDDGTLVEYDIKEYYIRLTPDEWARLSGQDGQGVSGDFFAGFCVSKCRSVPQIEECVLCLKQILLGVPIRYTMTDYGTRVLSHKECHEDFMEYMHEQTLGPEASDATEKDGKKAES